MNILLRGLQRFWFLGVVAIFFATVLACRPLLPVDETRYMTVAWEMYLRQGWFQPLTLNFEPYHHKPPFLFWAINLCWSIFGVSRWAGLIPPMVASAMAIYLTARLGQLLFPTLIPDRHRIMMVIVASVPFMVYGTLVMFDFMLCTFVLGALLSIVHFTRDRKWIYVLCFGAVLGAGVLTKGPVAYLYVLPPVLLAPFWVPNLTRRAAYYGAVGVGVLISALMIGAWLIPVLMHASGDFAFWLVWNQTAGRVTGNFSESHVRPFYFYVPFLPVLLLPWLFFPAFWRGLKDVRALLSDQGQGQSGLRFLACWFIPVFLAFSCISGKQIHYLVPIFPAVAILIVLVLQRVRTVIFARVAVGAVIFFVGAHIVASRTVLIPYDLAPVAKIIQDNPNHDWAYVQNYHGEFGFLARLTRPMEQRELSDIVAWFNDHPNGMSVIRYHTDADIDHLTPVIKFDYRSKHMGVFQK